MSLFPTRIRFLMNSFPFLHHFPFSVGAVARERSRAGMPSVPCSAGECHGSPGPCSELVVYGSGIRPLLTRKYTPPPHDRRNHHGIPACGIVNCTRRITYCALFTVERSETITETFGLFTQISRRRGGVNRPLTWGFPAGHRHYAGDVASCYGL